MLSWKRALGVVAVAWLCHPSLAQQVIHTADGEMVVFGDESGGFDPSMMEGLVQSPTPNAAGTVSPRQQRFAQLEFNRRPSAILAAWATPPKPPADAEAAKAAAPTEPAQPPADGSPALPVDPAQPVATEPAAAPKTPEEEAAAKAASEAAAKAAEAAAKAAEEAKKKAEEAKALEAELALFQRRVTLGEWPAVQEYLKGLTEAERKAGYSRLLQSLAQGPRDRPQVPPQGQLYIEKNRFAPSDVVGLARSAPDGLQKEHLASLGRILAQALEQGHQLERFLEEARPLLGTPECPLDRRQLALLLVGANQPHALEGLIPSVEEALGADDREGLNLISRYCLAQNDREAKVTWLEQAWAATLAVLAVGEVDEDAKNEALQRAVALAPKLKKELGQAWLDESFTSRPERGMEILSRIGSVASTSLSANPYDSDARRVLLELQTTAANALIAAAPERAKEWSAKLQLLALNWLAEADVTYQFDESSSLGPRRQRDRWGNYYYWSWNNGRNPNAPTAVTTEKILEIRPSDAWLELLEPSLVPRFRMLFASLFLKVGEDAQAFPYIEGIAASLPRQGKELADEFLRVWTKNHDPNQARQQENEYIFYYGFEDRANGIPLTRSKQERNLTELADWVARLKKLPIEVDDQLVTAAFTTAHSTAEVYRLETIERIFGSVAALEPALLASLVQGMRTNLLTIWRDPAVQEDKKTKRRQADIQAEVLRGYELAYTTVEKALADHPTSWQLHLAKAALSHDENDYRRELAKDGEFSSRREAAFALFHRAAELYREELPTLEEEKESTEVYDLWFNAALGSCDLRALDQEKQLATAEIPLIRESLLALPADRQERHLGKFAGSLFTKMSAVKPVCKVRFVREGLAIVGDHKLAAEAREVFDYYGDLVTEIQLRTTLDGGDRVGHEASFGLLVELRHTREIERESGGFGKYLQNQNAQNFSYNYGRPTEDYRDKFESTARAALSEHFEVQSVTFNDPATKSKADAEYGWRRTPYAYILMKSKGPQVDRIPPLRLDLDFLDTSGYAVLPIESAAIPIDSSTSDDDARTFENLAITQTLDERHAAQKKLVLEIKATARGLVPELERLVDFAPEGFDVAKTDDGGLSIAKFDEDGERVQSERLWTLTLQAKPELERLPTTFAFATAKAPETAMERFRYVDADLAKAEPTVQLEQVYGETSKSWLGWTLGGVVLVIVGLVLWSRRERTVVLQPQRYRVPDPVTPFTVLGLLREIESHDGLDASSKRELATTIATLEEGYFADKPGDRPDLRSIAETWAGRAT
ncbi:MAG: hypothetical protein IT453_06865 [Planctomycetes bacterium]|nr:hypothetical protein [Planctomycetota bacterium]